MNIFARFHRNKVGTFDDYPNISNHKKICGCRQCRKYRRKEIKVSCAFLMPLVSIIAFIGALL